MKPGNKLLVWGILILLLSLHGCWQTHINAKLALDFNQAAFKAELTFSKSPPLDDKVGRNNDVPGEVFRDDGQAGFLKK